MENIWDILSRRDYVNNKLFPSGNELEVAIERVMYNISETEFINLVTSMKGRLFKDCSFTLVNGGPIY